MLNQQRYSRRLAFWALAVSLLFAGTPVRAQDSGTLAGKWNMISTTPEGDEIPWTMTIKQDGDKYSATLSTPHGEQPAKDFKTDGTTVSLKVTYEDQEYQIKLKAAGNQLTGTWEGSNDSGQTKGTRSTGA